MEFSDNITYLLIFTEITFHGITLESCRSYVIAVQQVISQISNTSKRCHKSMRVCLLKLNDPHSDLVSTQSNTL